MILLSLFLSISGLASTQVDPVKEQVPQLEAFYKDLHENPELSGEEKRTAGKVAEEFRSLGLEVMEGIGGFGVVGILKNGKGPITMLRADMDALPVPEDTGLPYASKKSGVMHACGHDFHTTALIGAARTMAGTKDQWSGTLIFVAQPAEEVAKGALAMLKDGLLKKIPKPERILALHTSALYKRGTVAITPGYALANVDSVDVTFKGKGSHGSKPEFGIDPFVLAAEFTLKMQVLKGREVEALQPVVISVGSIHGGAKHNIIPDEVKMQLTLRSYDKAVREHLKKRIVEIAQGIAKTAGAPVPEVGFPESTDATFNDPELAAKVKAIFLESFGKENFTDSQPIMGGEDFGQFGLAAKVPSLFIWVGQQNPKDPKIANHSPRFFPDLKTLPVAVRAFVNPLMAFHKKPE